MAKSPLVISLDAVQERVTALLKPLGFRRHGRIYNRSREDGVVQVIGLQMGDYRPESRRWLVVNLGVHVREVWQAKLPREPPKVVQDYNCAIRMRLRKKRFWGEREARWDLTRLPDQVAGDVVDQLQRTGLSFLDRFATRDDIVRDWIGFNDRHRRLSQRARVDVAIILARQGKTEAAHQLLAEHLSQGSRNPGHPGYVRDLARKLGLGELPGATAAQDDAFFIRSQALLASRSRRRQSR